MGSQGQLTGSSSRTWELVRNVNSLIVPVGLSNLGLKQLSRRFRCTLSFENPWRKQILCCSTSDYCDKGQLGFLEEELGTCKATSSNAVKGSLYLTRGEQNVCVDTGPP